MELIGAYLAACLLLAVAGVAKALDPADTARAIAGALPGVALGPAGMRRLVRAGAGGEAALGVAGLVLYDRVLAAAVAVSYAAFAAYVLVARRRGGTLATCGCFGTPDTPATRLHVVVDLALAASALALALAAPGGRRTSSVIGVLGHQPWHGVPLALASAVCAWLVFHVLSTLPRLQAARHTLAVTTQ